MDPFNGNVLLANTYQRKQMVQIKNILSPFVDKNNPRAYLSLKKEIVNLFVISTTSKFLLTRPVSKMFQQQC